MPTRFDTFAKEVAENLINATNSWPLWILAQWKFEPRNVAQPRAFKVRLALSFASAALPPSPLWTSPSRAWTNHSVGRKKNIPWGEKKTFESSRSKKGVRENAASARSSRVRILTNGAAGKGRRRKGERKGLIRPLFSLSGKRKKMWEGEKNWDCLLANYN